MSVTARQIAILSAMGIPVWQQRISTQSADEKTLTNPLSQQQLEQLQQRLNSAEVIIHHDADNDETAWRLLNAILKTIDLKLNHEHIISQSELLALNANSIKLNPTASLFIFADKLFGNEQSQNGIETIYLPSLKQLAQQPQLKKQLWLTLQHRHQLDN